MGKLQIPNGSKKKLYISFGFLVVFVLLAIAVAPMLLAPISAVPDETATGSYVDMYYLATHPEEFDGKSAS